MSTPQVEPGSGRAHERRKIPAIRNQSAKRVKAGDAEIGGRIRTLRLQKGMSQTDLGLKLGVTFQQVQKYEKGVNRVSGSSLQRLCDILDTTPNYLLTGAHASGAVRTAEDKHLENAGIKFLMATGKRGALALTVLADLDKAVRSATIEFILSLGIAERKRRKVKKAD